MSVIMRDSMGRTIQIEVGDAKPEHIPEYEEDVSDAFDHWVHATVTRQPLNEFDVSGAADRVDVLGWWMVGCWMPGC